MHKPIPTLKKTVNNATAIPASLAQAFVETSKFPETAQHETTIEPVVAPPENTAVAAVAEASNDNLFSLRAPKVEAPKAASASKPSKSRRPVLTRADGAVVRKATVYLSPDLDRRLSLHALDTGSDRSDIVVAALERYLRSKE